MLKKLLTTLACVVVFGVSAELAAITCEPGFAATPSDGGVIYCRAIQPQAEKKAQSQVYKPVLK